MRFSFPYPLSAPSPQSGFMSFFQLKRSQQIQQERSWRFRLCIVLFKNGVVWFIFLIMFPILAVAKAFLHQDFYSIISELD